MKRFKELLKLGKNDITKKMNEMEMEIVKARVTASKGGKVKIRELKKTLANLKMLNKQNNGDRSKNRVAS
ncbi:hypothetical protein J4477_02600 [Candidatus Pacearchaeota archaeon]|nr:hypothetical protein [Candidatus Pacearchaeota archaeon]